MREDLLDQRRFQDRRDDLELAAPAEATDAGTPVLLGTVSTFRPARRPNATQGLVALSE